MRHDFQNAFLRVVEHIRNPSFEFQGLKKRVDCNSTKHLVNQKMTCFICSPWFNVRNENRATSFISEGTRKKGGRVMMAGADRNLRVKSNAIKWNASAASKVSADRRNSCNIIRSTRAEIEDSQDGSSSDSSSLTLLSNPMKGPSTSKPRVIGAVNFITLWSDNSTKSNQ